MVALFLRRSALIALAGAACCGLTMRCGAGTAAAIWSGSTALAGLAGALLLRFVPLGRVGWQNRLAGYLIPWGWRLNRGALWPIPVVSWIVWMSIGAAAIALACGMELLPIMDVAVRVALFAFWSAVGSAALFVLGSVRGQPAPSAARGRLLRIAAALAALIVASAAVFGTDRPVLALVLVAGPTLAVAGGYGLFLGAVLLLGRNARWN